MEGPCAALLAPTWLAGSAVPPWATEHGPPRHLPHQSCVCASCKAARRRFPESVPDLRCRFGPGRQRTMARPHRPVALFGLGTAERVLTRVPVAREDGSRPI